MRGTIINFNTVKGFGFIIDGAGVKYFFHISNVLNPMDIKENYSVEFTAKKNKKGMIATNITVSTPLASGSKDKILKLKNLRIRASDIKEYALRQEYITFDTYKDNNLEINWSRVNYGDHRFVYLIEIHLYSDPNNCRTIIFGSFPYYDHRQDEIEAEKLMDYLDEELSSLI